MNETVGAAARKKLLIIDDTPENIQLLMAILGRDYQIVAAREGERALALAASDPQPDLILLDIRMPGMDGFEVCEELKSDPKTRDIPVIFVTTMNADEDVRRGLELGAVDYITKPYSPTLVKARIHAHLSLERGRAGEGSGE
ncbi:response regulator [Geomonas sp. Red32]|uniref:response regulator n=1 Tax=Geomonas sp. Red32 TaxID=2912856 RepID=UPI00202CEB66|nr:response regulator [Geomonas sp. Red32]MCM0082897.1 response regulator [Geomonas sp. Red32]